MKIFTLVIFLTYSEPTEFFNLEEKDDNRKPLVSPSIGVSNNNLTNSNGDLIFYENDVISNKTDPECKTSSVYVVKSFIGSGSCGQVMKVIQNGTNETYALKVIKHAYACGYYAVKEKRLMEEVCVGIIIYSLKNK